MAKRDLSQYMFQFFYPVQVRYVETDQQGHVFFGHYLTYFDLALTEYLKAIDYSYDRFLKAGVDFFYVETLCQYHDRAFFDDVLHVHARSRHVPAAHGQADASAVEGSRGPGGDHRTEGRGTDQRPASQRLEGVREDLGVGVRLLVAQGQRWPGPCCQREPVLWVGSDGRAAVAGNGVRVSADHEHRHEEVRGPATPLERTSMIRPSLPAAAANR